MESAELANRLESARKAVAEGEVQIQRQRDLIARLKEAGEDTDKARAVLKTLAKRQAERLENLGYIMRQFPQ